MSNLTATRKIMKLNRLLSPSYARLAISEVLIITLTTLLCLPSTSSATLRGNVSPRKVGGSAVMAAHAPLVGLIWGNTTSDADNLDPNAGCDTDAATPGEQCSLRAAIQRANALAGDDEISFNIPSTQPNCDPSGINCKINLTKALPDLSTNIRIISPGIDKIAVRRSAGGDYGIFRVVFASDVTLSGLRIQNGRPFGIAASGISHEGTGTVNVVDSILTDNLGGTIAGSGGALANSSIGTLNVINCIIADNQATATGGGINNGNSGTLNVIGSFILRNTVNVPGGIGQTGSGGGLSNSNQGPFNITKSGIADKLFSGASATPFSCGGVSHSSNGKINITCTVGSKKSLICTNHGGGNFKD